MIKKSKYNALIHMSTYTRAKLPAQVAILSVSPLLELRQGFIVCNFTLISAPLIPTYSVVFPQWCGTYFILRSTLSQQLTTQHFHVELFVAKCKMVLTIEYAIHKIWQTTSRETFSCFYIPHIKWFRTCHLLELGIWLQL